MIIEILRCPRHASSWAVAINDLRVTPSKCCGEWVPVSKWNIATKSLVADIHRAVHGTAHPLRAVRSRGETA